MYLTRLTLDPRSAQARLDLTNPYDMHRTLVRAFVADEQQKPPRFLWRLEPQLNWHAPPIVLVQSCIAADWQYLHVLPNYLRGSPETKIFDEKGNLGLHQCYRFRLFANPTVTRDGKRYGLLKEADQLAWLVRQGQRHGFELTSVIVTACDMLHTKKQAAGITLLRACYEGGLRVTDPGLLENAVRTGIGPGKAFGCGLLSLAKAGFL